jgi:hypothetical protein
VLQIHVEQRAKFRIGITSTAKTRNSFSHTAAALN